MKDPIDARRQWFLHLFVVTLTIIALMIIVVVASLDLLHQLEGQGSMVSVYWGVGSFLITALVVMVVSRRISVEIAGIILLLFITEAITLWDAPAEVADGRTVFMFAIPILASSFIIRPWASFILAGVASMAVIFLGAQIPGYVINPFVISGFVILAMMAWGITSTLEGALRESESTNQELKETKHKLERALRGARAIVWDWRIDEGKIDIILQDPEEWGFEGGELETSLEDLQSRIEPEELEGFIEYFRGMANSPDGQLEYEMGIQTGNGRSRRVNIVGNFIENGDGSRRAAGTLVDITERRRTEELKGLFQSMIVHDIGERLQFLHGYLDLEGSNDGGKSLDLMREKTMETLLAAERMVKLADLLRELDNDPVGSVEPYFLVRETSKSLSELALEMGKEMELSISKEGPKVRSDSLGGVLMETVFYNMIESSILHPGGKKVRITSTETERTVIISFEDDSDASGDAIRSIVSENKTTDWEEIGFRISKGILDHLGGGLRFSDSPLGGVRIDVEFVRTMPANQEESSHDLKE